MRLVWDNWERFNGAQDDPDSSTDYVTPKMVSKAGGYDANTIHDYFGLPVNFGGAGTVEHVAYFHRAYYLIWNEWFRDQNMQDSLPVPKDDGPDLYTEYELQRRGKRHDYFTSALPWPQKGPAIDIPLGSTAPVLGLLGNNSNTIAIDAGNVLGGSVGAGSQSQGAAYQLNWQSKSPVGTAFATAANATNFNVYADLSQASAATINQLRQAFQVQKLYERDARGGTRYTEIILAHFGVRSPDARLQRPEYLGGGSSYINVTPIAQTSETTTESPQANLAAIGTGSIKGHGFTKSFTEHCLIIGMVSVRADLTYQQGLERMWSRSTRFDFYWPALSHIGEQAVLNQEIFAQGTSADTDVFGYQERYAEYRYKPSQITGEFRSNFAQSLDTWHLSQDFSTLPALNADFIQENPPVDRVIAVQDEPHFLFDSLFQMNWARPMPVYGVPGLIDHF